MGAPEPCGAPCPGDSVATMRFFNTAGPCIEGVHYMLPPLDRIPEARELVDRGSTFVVHAPRQSGKTTALRALAKALTEGRGASAPPRHRWPRDGARRAPPARTHRIPRGGGRAA
jgi:hypothetical protein